MLKSKKTYLNLLVIVALILQVVAIATNDWSVYSGASKMNWGLWKSCAGNTHCLHLPPEGNKMFPKNSLEAARAFAILGSLSMAISLYYMNMYPTKKLMLSHLLLAGGICSVVAAIIWSAELLKWPGSTGKDVKASPGYSFYLNLSGGVLAVVAAVANHYG